MALKENGGRVPGWPDYVADLKARGLWNDEESRSSFVSEWERLYKEQQALDEAPIVSDLRSAGIDVSSPWDLVGRKTSCPPAMPILFKHLCLSYPSRVREGLARGMSDSAAKRYWPELASLYSQETNKEVKDALAVALNGALGAEHHDDLIKLVLDVKNGPSRVLLIWALQYRVDPERAEPALVKLIADPVAHLEAKPVLKKVQAKIVRGKRKMEPRRS